jgi:hypothetical protein
MVVDRTVTAGDDGVTNAVSVSANVSALGNRPHSRRNGDHVTRGAVTLTSCYSTDSVPLTPMGDPVRVVAGDSRSGMSAGTKPLPRMA